MSVTKLLQQAVEKLINQPDQGNSATSGGRIAVEPKQHRNTEKCHDYLGKRLNSGLDAQRKLKNPLTPK